MPRMASHSACLGGFAKNYVRITLTHQLEAPIPKLDADKLSERLYRHHTHQGIHAGTGLGVSIVQAIVNAHHDCMNITVQDHYRYNPRFQVRIEMGAF